MATNEQIEGVLKNAIKKIAFRNERKCTDIKIIIETIDDKHGTPEYYLQISDGDIRILKFSEIYMGMNAWLVESGAKRILSESIRKKSEDLKCKCSQIKIHVCTDHDDADTIFFRLFPETEETKFNIDQIITKR